MEAAKVGLAINPDKTKVTHIWKWHETNRIEIDEVPTEKVEDFCYLGSMMSLNSSCDKEIKTHIGKANAVFERLERIWKSIGCSVDTKVQLSDSILLSTLLYGAETRPITTANGRRLEAAHHRWQRRILHVSWRDKIPNMIIRERTGQEELGCIIRTRAYFKKSLQLHREKKNSDLTALKNILFHLLKFLTTLF